MLGNNPQSGQAHFVVTWLREASIVFELQITQQEGRKLVIPSERNSAERTIGHVGKYCCRIEAIYATL